MGDDNGKREKVKWKSWTAEINKLAEQLTHDPNFECSGQACAASMGNDNGTRDKSYIVKLDSRDK